MGASAPLDKMAAYLVDFSQTSEANEADFFLDRHLREKRGGRTAFIDENREITYAALCSATADFARGFAKAQLKRGSRIALLLLDSIAFPIAFWGALRSGMVAVPINHLLPASQIAFILRDCGAEAVVISASLLPDLSNMLATIPALRVIIADSATEMAHSTDPRVIEFEDFIEDGEPTTPPVEVCATELAFLLYTSGSTGEPKGVRHLHGAMRATALTYAAHILAITKDDVVFSAAKLFFGYGLGNSISFPMAVGAASILSPFRTTPENILNVMARDQPSIFFGVPTLYAKLLQERGLRAGAGSKRLRLCVSAGEALPAPIAQRWLACTGIDVLDGVGTTEMLHIFVSNRAGTQTYGNSGVAVPGYELRLIDEHGDDIVDQGEGEMLVRGPSMADGYWNQPEKTRATFRGQWVATGDRYIRDAKGIYHFCGRTDDMIKAGGIWVSPFEVESSLTSHPSVLEAAVVGCEDQDGLTKPRAFVVLRPGKAMSPTLISQLQAHVKKQIGPWKYPRWIDIVPQLPQTANGKIQRFKLREQQLEAVM